MIDFSKIQKGAKVKLKDGTVVKVHGMYLSSDGPVLMCKRDPSVVAGMNVPVDRVEEIVEETK